MTSSSDIEKNGKSTLSALAVGDTVAFSTVTTDGTTVHRHVVRRATTVGHGRRMWAWWGANPGHRPRNTPERARKHRELERFEQFEQLQQFGIACLIPGSEHLGSRRDPTLPVSATSPGAQRERALSRLDRLSAIAQGGTLGPVPL